MINSLLEDRRDNLVVMATGKLPLHPKKQQKVVPFLGESSKTNVTWFFGLTKGLESSVVAAEKAQCLTSAFFFPSQAMEKAYATNFLLFTLGTQELSSALSSP